MNLEELRTQGAVTIRPWKQELGRISVSVRLATEREALAFQHAAPDAFRPGDDWQVLRGRLHHNVVNCGRRPWHVELHFVNADWIQSAQDARSERRKEGA